MTATVEVKPRKAPLVHSKINRTPVNKDSIEALTRETDRPVTGTFNNIETPGQPAKISGKFYRDMPYFSKTFTDGEKCTIPLSVARFINERIIFEQHTNLIDEKGNPIKGEKRLPRYKFTPEF